MMEQAALTTPDPKDKTGVEKYTSEPVPLGSTRSSTTKVCVEGENLDASSPPKEQKPTKKSDKNQKGQRKDHDHVEKSSGDQNTSNDDDEASESDEASSLDEEADSRAKKIKAARRLIAKYSQKVIANKKSRPDPETSASEAEDTEDESQEQAQARNRTGRASKAAYKRVDKVWDSKLLQWKLRKSGKKPKREQWDQYIFTIQRNFDLQHTHQQTLVIIKSRPLREALQHVLKGVTTISLVGDTPDIDPNMLFLHLEECRIYLAKMQKHAESAKNEQDRKAAATKSQHLKVLIKYLDKDYDETKKRLYPMLANNTITFDLLWALLKPNTITYCSTYEDHEQPRAFKIDYAVKQTDSMKGTYFYVEGRCLDYDGKNFGMGTISYHKDPEALKATLIERGKKFVALQGMNYRYHKGMAYTWRKKQVIRVNVNGRVMVDPATHRRINPNYPGSTVEAKDDSDDLDFENDASDDSEGREDSDGGHVGKENAPFSSDESGGQQRRYRIVQGSSGGYVTVEVGPDEENNDRTGVQEISVDTITSHGLIFSENDLLIASPVVRGFAFKNQKSIIKALVSSHAFHPTRSVDDVITGKGRGLVAVLHGPPGTGKTLTAEGIAELLKRPLYMVSAGDLGTSPHNLEKELQSILDIAHSWGAILLLDEADVFLEERSIHDIHRNALVSIFLRHLEYFQGTLFLTTNRVETFDEAFVSRIHLSLRYEELTHKAKKSVWEMFILRVKASEGTSIGRDITEENLIDLSRRDVNGRQIKNLVRAAHALAMHENKHLSMAHIRRVIDVAESFERDLKGGTGYTVAMRSYT